MSIKYPLPEGYRQGDTVPTFHNVCGRRTLYKSCDCSTCRNIHSQFDKFTGLPSKL